MNMSNPLSRTELAAEIAQNIEILEKPQLSADLNASESSADLDKYGMVPADKDNLSVSRSETPPKAKYITPRQLKNPGMPSKKEREAAKKEKKEAKAAGKQSKYGDKKKPGAKPECRSGAQCEKMLSGECQFYHPQSDRPCHRGAACRNDECPYNHDIDVPRRESGFSNTSRRESAVSNTVPMRNSLDVVAIPVDVARDLFEKAGLDIRIMSNGVKNMFISESKNMISEDLRKLL